MAGLRVASEIPLPLPASAPSRQPDIVVHRGERLVRGSTLDREVAAAGGRWTRAGDRWRLLMQATDGEVLQIDVDCAGEVIEVQCSLAGEYEDIGVAVIGLALGSALALRGIPVFHASAVVIGDRAILLAGSSGAGKSTLTAALVARGTALLADDLAALEFRDGAVIIQPGCARLNVYRDSLAVLAGSRSVHHLRLQRVFSSRNRDEKYWAEPDVLGGTRYAASARLCGVYLLSPREAGIREARIQPLARRDAALRLLEHVYGKRRGIVAPREQLEWCAGLSSRVSVSSIVGPDRLDSVLTTAAAIEQHVRESARQ